MAWVGDHIFSYGQAYAGAMCICCPESPETVVEDRREIGPTYFFAPPRVFENLLTQVMVRMEDAGWLKRRMFRYFLGIARRCGERVLDGKPVGFKDRALYRLGDLLVYAPLRNRMGFSRTRVAYTAGEAIGPELFSFYRSLGVNLKQLYGQTEASVYITMQPDGEVYPDTVGKPGPDVQIKIADSGEVLFKSPGVFLKYYKNDAATSETKTADGWVHTGDAGFFDQRGHLKIIDRAKDVGRLNNGALFAPKYLDMLRAGGSLTLTRPPKVIAPNERDRLAGRTAPRRLARRTRSPSSRGEKCRSPLLCEREWARRRGRRAAHPARRWRSP